MKNFITKMSLLLAFVLTCCFMQDAHAQRTTIAGWTFPSATGSNVMTAECGTGTLYADGSHGSSVWTVVTGGTTPGIFFNNSGIAPAEALCEVTSAGKSLSVIGSANNDSSIVIVVSTLDLGNIEMTFNTRGTSSGFNTQTWSHSVNGIDWIQDLVVTDIGTTNTPFGNLRTIDFPADADNQAELYIKVTFTGGSATNTSGNNRLDNICITGESMLPVTAAATPEFSAAAGNYCNPFAVTITCNTEGASIYYTTDGTTPSNVNGTLYTGSINIAATTTLQAIAYAAGLDASAVQTIDYVLPTEVATIAAFKADTEHNYFKLTGDLTVNCKADPSTSSHYVFVEDATAATCLYQTTTMGAFANGDVISGGVCGVKDTYYGMIELKNPEFQNPTTTAGTPVEPITLTIAALNANFANYECRLVNVTNATFTEAGNFTNSVNSLKNLVQNQDTALVANQFRTIDAFAVYTSQYDVTGVAIGHDAQHRICPRGTYDIVSMIPTVAITSPYFNQTVEQGETLLPAFTTTYFAFDNGAMIHSELSLEGQTVSDIYIHNDTELATYTSTDLTAQLTGFGACQLVISLLAADNSVLATDTVAFNYTSTYVAIETSESALEFSETGESHTLAVTAFHLTNGITLSVNDANFVVTPTTLSATAENETVTVTFVGTETTTAQLSLTSDTVTTVVALNAVIPIDEVIYTTGFEVEQGFTATNTYNNDNPSYFGPDGQQWSTIHGTVTATQGERIFGDQVAQMRYYGAAGNQHLGHIGRVVANFDLHNVTKVEFYAKNNGVLNLTASCSFDGGATFSGDTTYTITTNATKYVFNVSDSGDHYGNRIKFEVALPDSVGTGTYKLTIDSVVVYGVTGLEPSIVETPVISEPSNSYVNPITVTLTCATEDAIIYYTTDGTTPDETSTRYYNPFTLDSTCTLKARAFKGGMDPSTIAFAEYTFPVQVANIAAFKAAGAIDNVGTYKISGPVTFVYRNGRRIFIEDATGGLLVYDNATPVITRSYNEGDVINNGIVGTYTVYNGMGEMIPAADWSAAFGTATVTPVLVTAQQLRSDFATYEARLVRINDVTFTNGAEFNTGEITEAEAQDATSNFVYRNQFKTLDTTLAAGAEADVIGLAAIYATADETTYQLFPRTNADILEVVGIEEAEMLNVSVFPNPTTGVVYAQCTQFNAACTVEISDMYGRILAVQQGDGDNFQVDFSSYAPGMYMMRFVENNKVMATAKVVRK